jgi:hypothetical protein
MAKVKKGDRILFNFHCAGVVSQEETTVTKVGKDYIQISDGEPEYRFDKKTGNCLNENNYFNSKRTLPKEYLD